MKIAGNAILDAISDVSTFSIISLPDGSSRLIVIYLTFERRDTVP